MALVALGSTAAPDKLHQTLQRRWFNRWAILAKHTEETRNSKRVEDELHKALQSHGATTAVGDLRATLGLPLDGQHKRRFNKALFMLVSPPPKKRRARRRFTMAEGGLRSDTCSSKRPKAESA